MAMNVRLRMKAITVTLVIYSSELYGMRCHQACMPGSAQWKSLYSSLTCTGIINTVTNRSATALLTNMKLVIDLESETFQKM